MNDERYSIFYSSRTGNTRLLAEAIRESLPADLCNHFGTDEAGAVESEKLYVGFWTDKGTADEAALALLKRLKNQEDFPVRYGGLRRKRGVFSKGAGSGKGEHRREQFDHRHLYVPRQNAHGGPGAV